GWRWGRAARPPVIPKTRVPNPGSRDRRAHASPDRPPRPHAAMTAPSIYLSAVTPRQRITPPPPERRMLWTGILLGYGIAFTLLRSSASFWATHELFSLWFPAAGLRFAFLWWAGPRIAPLAALS